MSSRTLIVMALVGGLGYYLWQKSQAKPAPAAAADQQPNSQSRSSPDLFTELVGLFNQGLAAYNKSSSTVPSTT